MMTLPLLIVRLQDAGDVVARVEALSSAVRQGDTVAAQHHLDQVRQLLGLTPLVEVPAPVVPLGTLDAAIWPLVEAALEREVTLPRAAKLLGVSRERLWRYLRRRGTLGVSLPDGVERPRVKELK